MYQPTKLEKQIESIVTNGVFYGGRTKEWMPVKLQDKEIGLQLALGYMDAYDGKLSMNKMNLHNIQIQKTVIHLGKAGIPLEDIIASVDDFNYALSFVGSFKIDFRAMIGAFYRKLFGEPFFLDTTAVTLVKHQKQSLQGY